MLRVGLAVPLSGPLALTAPSALDLAGLATEEANAAGGVGGREVQLVAVDSGRAPAVVAAEVTSLIEAGVFDVLVGFHTSDVHRALETVLPPGARHVYTPPHEGGRRRPGVLRTGVSPVDQHAAALTWLVRRRRARRWVLLGTDYVWPRAVHRAARRVLADAGGEVVGEALVPFGPSDTGPLLDLLRRTRADGRSGPSAPVVCAYARGGFDFSPVYNSDTFSLELVFGAVSIAVLSFLGFDAISTLAEENRDSARSLGKSMIAALVLAGTLFIVQTWVAALLVPEPETLIAEGDAAGIAFYDAAGVAGGEWLATLTAVATAIAWGFANSLVAQAATSRLLFAMARDRQLPGFLATVHPVRRVPVNATLLVAAVSLVLGIYMSTRDDGITLLSTLVNFGALSAFLLLHMSVVVHYIGRLRSRNWWLHLVVPVVGFAILAYVVYNAQVAAQELGFVWFAIGLVLLVVLLATGRRPELKAEENL